MTATNGPPDGLSPARRTDQPTGLAWGLWPLLAALPWLLPTHTDPWPVFYSEWWAAATLLPIGLWALLAAKGRWPIDGLVAGGAALALVPLLQALGGMFVLPREAVWSCLYIAGFVLTLLVARQAEAVARGRLIDALFTSLAIAALVSTGLALYQWLGLDALELMVAPAVPGGRPAANVGQPNNLSTLLVWGLVAVWWGHSRQRIGGAVALLAAAFLLVGVALTQSRTGWLAIGLLGAAAVLGRRILGTRQQVLPLAALAAWFVLWVVVQEPLGQLLLRSAPLSLADQVAVGKRPMIWQLAIDAIALKPWLGWGWNQSTAAHVALAAQFPQLQVTVQHAHNLVLDLALWNGLPLALLVTGGLGVWTWHQLRSVRTPAHLLVLLALGVFALHAMLELPHAYAFFLLPVAVMMGTASAFRPATAWLAVPRAVVVLPLLLMAAALALMFDEYGRIETDLVSYRMRMANIGLRPPPPSPQPLLLQPLQAALEQQRTTPRRGMAGDELDRMRANLTRYPSLGGLFRFARASALNGRPDDARWALGLLCDLNPARACETAAQDWQTMAADRNPEMAAIVFPRPAGGKAPG